MTDTDDEAKWFAKFEKADERGIERIIFWRPDAPRSPSAVWRIIRTWRLDQVRASILV